MLNPAKPYLANYDWYPHNTRQMKKVSLGWTIFWCFFLFYRDNVVFVNIG